MVPPPNSGSSVGVNGKLKISEQTTVDKIANSPLLFFFARIFIYVFGFFNWCLYILLAIRGGTFFTRTTETEKNQLAIAQDAFWNLSKQPISGFRHELLKTRTGFQFHYLCNRGPEAHKGDLIFFIHGFPNTSMTWRFMLKEAIVPVDKATVIAVDMPGYGGSDSLERYDTQVLELLTEFLVSIREKYGMEGNSVGSTTIISHDWGCAIGMRLAAEAPCLADRWIMSNGPLMGLVVANCDRATKSSRRIFKQFWASPLSNFACLGKSFQAVRPLLRQMILSGYIFVFQLPPVFIKYLAEGGNFSFFRAVFTAEHGKPADEYNFSTSLAANMGPSVSECQTQTADGLKYGPSVATRVQSIGEIFWQTTGYYRHGLATSTWEKSIETIAALHNIDSDLSSSDSPSRRRSSASTSALFSDQVKGSLRAPSTIIWGEQDIALSRAICLDGIADYLAKESEVILLPQSGHWVPVEKHSRKVLGQIIRMFANGDSKSAPSFVATKVQQIDPGATLLAKR